MLLIQRFVYLFIITNTLLVSRFLFGNPQYYWLILSIILFSILPSERRYFNFIVNIFLTAVITAGLVFIASITTDILALNVLMFVVVFGVLMQWPFTSKYFFSGFIICIFMIIAAFSQVHLPAAIDRVYFITEGVCIVALAQIVLLPQFPVTLLQRNIQHLLKDLMEINNAIFISLLKKEYATNIYLFEKNLHFKKKSFLTSLQQFRRLVNSLRSRVTKENFNILQQLIADIDLVYSIFLDLAQIRHRVTDHTTFGICENELNAIRRSLDKHLLQIYDEIKHQKKYLDHSLLMTQIRNLETISQNVLQVTAKEPLVFLLFISSLKSLNEELVLIYKNLHFTLEVIQTL